MEVSGIKKTKHKLRTEAVRCYKWTCLNCDETYEEEVSTVEEFVERLVELGVRHVEMKHMQGVLCQTCYLDPEVQNSSL